MIIRRFFVELSRLLGLARGKKKKTNPIKYRRLELSAKLDRMLKSTVKYGPFKGLKLTPQSWWGSTDKGSMLLGMYEKELLDSLVSVPKKYKTFIDLGAADGYYGVGVLVNDLFERSYCFEMSEKGRQVIRRNAKLNRVSGRVSIYGKADKDFYKTLKNVELDKSVLFIDIEGAEFDLLDRDALEAFGQSIIFIELHDWFFKDGQRRLKRLYDDVSHSHHLTEMTTTSRNPSEFDELRRFNDTDRWLICSEGRGRLMTWLRLDPK